MSTSRRDPSGGVPTRSLRLRVVVGVLVVLTAALATTGWVVERVLAAQLRGDLEQRLRDRVAFGSLLASRGLTGSDLADALGSGDGVRVTVTTADGSTVVAAPPTSPPPHGRPPAPPRAPASVAAQVSVTTDARGIVASAPAAGGRVTATGSTADIDHTLTRLRAIEAVAGTVLLGVVAALLLGVVRFALHPLDRMTVLARSITRGGRGGRLRPRQPRTDLGRTAAAFDDALDALEAAERDARAAAAAASAERERMRRLLADVSHELRTPVAVLQARAETLLRDDPPRARREELAVGMVRETRRAARLVDDLLLVDRLEHAPGSVLHREPLDLAALVASVVGELDPGAEVVAPEAVPVVADPGRVAQVVRNLVSNARRAAGPAGRVAVSVGRDGASVVVTVTDDGPGVPDADRDRVFDRFVRLDAARSRADGGSGLGLPISRGLARAHGGDVVCRPATDGACFVLTLPASHPAADAVPRPVMIGG